MLKWFLSRWITKFERTWNYDASYLRDVLDADPRAMMAFSKVTAFGQYHKDVPLAVYCAAGIVGAMREAADPRRRPDETQGRGRGEARGLG